MGFGLVADEHLQDFSKVPRYPGRTGREKQPGKILNLFVMNVNVNSLHNSVRFQIRTLSTFRSAKPV